MNNATSRLKAYAIPQCFLLLFCLMLLPCAKVSGQISVYPPPAKSGSEIRAQQLVNDTIKLSEAGVSDELIIQQINSKGRVKLSADQLLQLKDASVSEQVLQALLGVPIKAAVTPAQKPLPKSKINDGKIRVYVTDRPITEVITMIRGGSAGTAQATAYSASAQEASGFGGVRSDSRGGVDPRTLEVSADILEKCHVSNLVVTNDPALADFVMDFRRQGGTRSTFFALGGLSGLAISSAIKVDYAALYAPNGDLIYASKARTVEGAVNEVCLHFKSGQPEVPIQQNTPSPTKPLNGVTASGVAAQ